MSCSRVQRTFLLHSFNWPGTIYLKDHPLSSMLQWKLLKLSDPKHWSDSALAFARLLSNLSILEPISHCLVYCALLQVFLFTSISLLSLLFFSTASGMSNLFGFLYKFHISLSMYRHTHICICDLLQVLIVLHYLHTHLREL